MADPRNKASFDLADQYKNRIERYLKMNSSVDRAFTSTRLAEIFRIKETVVVRQAIGKARDDGAPIASGSTGYFYAKKPDELTKTIADLNSRIAAIGRRRDALIETRIKMNDGPKQESMFDEISEWL